MTLSRYESIGEQLQYMNSGATPIQFSLLAIKKETMYAQMPRHIYKQGCLHWPPILLNHFK